jgi:NAD(P)-dependent dehydrogenase (short-subunit alcohol dehydrogenase family)/pimeloyl-ACP methyl ester carboxylesterase
VNNGVASEVVSTDGVRLAVFASGDPEAPTVLLVHGYPDTHRVWDEVSAALGVGHHVVRYDVRGAGLSGAPREVGDYRLDQLADDLFAVAAAVSPDRPVHVAGHDWGSVQAWHAVTDPRAADRIASFTTISGPCLDHAGHWYRRRLARPTPRHLVQMAGQSARSWYITVFQLPLVAPLAWRHGLARRWAGILERGEGVTPRPGLVSATLADDAVRGLNLYRANMRPRMRHPSQRIARIPVQVITLSRDRYLSPAMVAEDLHRWAPRLTRRTIDATHWSALTEKGPVVAGMISTFAAGSGDAEAGAAAAGAGRPFAGRLAVITGGGSGIGRATALAFADRGAKVVVCDVDLEAARRTAELASLLGPAGHAYLVDVSDGPAMDAFAAEISDTHGVPDILVNNAGIGHAGTVLATTEKEWQRVLDVNLWGVIHGCRAFGSRMEGGGAGGHIVNVASAAAYMPSKDLAAYATSKAAVVALSDCLRGELAHSGIGVSVICPGFVHTNITRTTTFSGLPEKEEAERRDRATRRYARRNYPPEKVAEQIAGAVLHKRAMVPVTPEARAGWLIARFAPGLARAAARRGLA